MRCVSPFSMHVVDNGEFHMDIFLKLVILLQCLQSRALRNNDPYFIWSLRKNEFSTSYLKKEQMFNHFSKAWFTTKVLTLFKVIIILCL